MKRRVLVYVLLILAVTSLPYLMAWGEQGDDWRFSGFLFGAEDGYSYLGKMRLGGRGVLDFSLFYTSEPHDAVPLVFLPYIVPGYIVGRIVPETSPNHTNALIITYHALRILADALLIVVLDRFIGRFISNERTRLAALVLATLGGGIGWVGMFLFVLPPEFYIPEGFSFMILFSLPHLALARAALLGGLLLLVRSAEYRVLSTEGNAVGSQPAKRDPSSLGTDHASPETSVPHPHPSFSQHSALSTPYLHAAAAGLCWLVVGLAVPFYLVVIYAVLGAWGLALWLRQRQFPTALFLRCLVAGGITLPLFLYYTVAFATNPAFAVWSAQNQLPSPFPIHYLLAYSLLGIPALLGIVHAWREARTQGRYALLVGWVIIVPVLVYLPINVQRRMAEGVIVPLAVLASIGLQAWGGTRTGRRWLARVWIGAACLSSLFLLQAGFIAASHAARPLFRPVAEVAALDWLNAHAPADAVVLSSVSTGNVLPAYTHLRPFMGHGPETLEWPRKTALVEQFFASGMNEGERAALYDHTCLESVPALCSAPIQYLIYGPREQVLAGNAAPNWQAEWQLIYDADGYQIYERLRDEA